MKKTRMASAIAVTAAALIIAAQGGVSAMAATSIGSADVVADWKFQQANSTGSIENKDLVIKDATGNGNDLVMQTYGDGDLSGVVSWSDDSMTGDAGSIKLNGVSSGTKHGVDFITKDGAAINSDDFADGYTLEMVYYLPSDFNAGTDSWMGLMARQSAYSNMDEHEMGSMSLAVSNCKETQFKAANKDNESTANTEDPNNGVTSWGVTMDHGGV